MVTVKQILDSLSEQERAQLNYAFEQGLSQYIELKDGRFIGVNVESIRFLKPQMRVGNWSVGEIKQ